ncbi:MAG: HAD family phosphatase [Patescibacteria group bacterium]|nr:HAD family phosphatase [Patescibacteria group bacterium]
MKHKLKAIIWDFDGTIADTQKMHAKTEVQTLKKYGIKISEHEITQRFAGVKLSVIFKTLFDENNITTGYLESRKIKWKMVDKIISKTAPKFMPGVKKLFRECKKQNIIMAIASSSIKSYLDRAINKMGIQKLFEVVVSGNDVRLGKPNPEIFIKTMKLLKISNKECIVIEDGNAGVIAAQKAKIKCIAVGDHIDKSIIKKTSMYVDSLKKLNLNFIKKYFGF